VKRFDSDGSNKTIIDEALVELEEFRQRFPFDTDPASIDKLTPEDLYNPGTDSQHFFWWLEHPLAPLGKMGIKYDTGLKNAAANIDLFKKFLHGLMDPELKLSEKIDQPTEQIKHLGSDKLVIKKILSCYDDSLIPIFKTDDLYHFFDRIVGSQELPRSSDQLSKGRKYEILMNALLEKKDSDPLARNWNNYYFMRFLYATFPKAQRPTPSQPVSYNKLREYGLISEPRCEQEVVVLFAKMHEELGYPVISKVQTDYPDVYVQGPKGKPIRIELEYKASGFRAHSREASECDLVICWEDDEGDRWPTHWPPLIALREYFVDE